MAKGKYQRWLEPEGLILLEGWARDGLTDEQIAYNMGCSRSTLNVWKNKYPVISDTLKEGKEVVDRKVENALLKSALNGNVTAQIYWIKNRMRDKYSDKPTRPKDGAGRSSECNERTTAQKKQVSMDLSRLTDQELETLESILAKLHAK